MNQLSSIWKPEVLNWWTENDIKMPVIGVDPLFIFCLFVFLGGGADPLKRQAEEDVLMWPLEDSQLAG